jgi:acyl-coenzyme A synthetase/AMP-(fatty) acid ligase/acyl carrier protein
VLCGGEAVPRDLANELIDRSPSVWNMYGPTETTVWSTCCQLQDKQGPVMIGRPIANTPVYILDQHLQPVPLGVSGELYIGGAGVSRGYLNRPDLTEKAFVKNPFSPDPSAVMYKTGDLTRYYANGNIEFLGRIDQQIKIRGFRVELGEIETVLLEHPSIKQAVVIVREDRPGDARLVAYMVHAEGLKIDSKELRQFLRKKLPDYMIPQHFVELDTLPRTPNGKINRKALPKPDAGMQADDNYKEPQTAIEKQLAAIWADILGTKKVGSNDSFFELGGHSVLAIQVVSAVRDSLSVDLPLRAIFETPILIDLAQHIEALLFAFSAATEKAEGSIHEREEIEI